MTQAFELGALRVCVEDGGEQEGKSLMKVGGMKEEGIDSEYAKSKCQATRQIGDGLE